MGDGEAAIPSRKSRLLWALVGLLVLVSLVCWIAFFVGASPSPLGLALAAALLLIGAAWLALHSATVDTRVEALFAFPDAVDLAASKTQELRRDYNRAVTAIEDVQHVVATEAVQVARLVEEMKRLNALTAAAEQRLSDEIAARKTAEAALQQWQDRVLEVVRGIERLSAIDGVSEDYRAGAEKVLSSLERQLSVVGLDLIQPKPGDPFDDVVHQVIDEVHDPSLPPGSIARVLSWGVMAGTRRERAEVVLVAARSEA